MKKSTSSEKLSCFLKRGCPPISLFFEKSVITIPVGSKIAADTLDVDLEAGTYDCTAMFHSLDPDTGTILGSAGANITITIQH